jgi:hypothetical protein
VCCLSTNLLVRISQVGMEPMASGGVEAFLFSQCNMKWRRAGGLGCLSFAYSWWFFFLPSVGPASQQDFRFTELMLSATSL